MCTHRTEHQLIYYIHVKASPDTVLQDVFILSDFLQSKFRDNPIMGYVVRSKQVSSATSTSDPFNRNSLRIQNMTLKLSLETKFPLAMKMFFVNQQISLAETKGSLHQMRICSSQQNIWIAIQTIRKMKQRIISRTKTIGFLSVISVHATLVNFMLLCQSIVYQILTTKCNSFTQFHVATSLLSILTPVNFMLLLSTNICFHRPSPTKVISIIYPWPQLHLDQCKATASITGYFP